MRTFGDCTKRYYSIFTDAVFRAYVYNAIGKTTTEPIYDTDVENIKGLIVSFAYKYNIDNGYKISSISGIEFFKNLSYFDCHNQEIMNLDLRNNKALTDLYCGINKITSLDLSNNTALQKIDCSSNYNLTNLIIRKNNVLRELKCYDCSKLTNLDLSDNTALTTLSCAGNKLTSLNVLNDVALVDLDCWGNQLTSLDVSTNLALTKLSCSSNQLKSLDVSKNSALTFLDCSSNYLTSLDVSKNLNLVDLYCSGNFFTKADVKTNTTLKDFDVIPKEIVETPPDPPLIISINNFNTIRSKKQESGNGLFAGTVNDVNSQKILEKSELEVLKNLETLISSAIFNSFDYKISVSKPVQVRDKWKVTHTVSIVQNQNFEEIKTLLIGTLLKIGMDKNEISTYQSMNKPLYRFSLIKQDNEPTWNDFYRDHDEYNFFLRNSESFEEIGKILNTIMLKYSTPPFLYQKVGKIRC